MADARRLVELSMVPELATEVAAQITGGSGAPLASPAFTGNPTAPTPATADNTTSIATTAFVKAQGYAPLAAPTFTGVPAAPTAAVATNTTQLATTAFVNAATRGKTQTTAIVALTGAFGTTGDAIVDVTAAFSQSILNNNFRALEDKVNAILAALKA